MTEIAELGQNPKCQAFPIDQWAMPGILLCDVGAS